MYIDNYPLNWKYVSLFATSDDPEKDKETQLLRKERMEKILYTAQYKA